MVVLAGGMATRFGGEVKAVVEAIDGRSFLEVKLAETQRLATALETEIPVALMTSFATDDAVRAHVAARAARSTPLLPSDRGAATAAGRQPVPRRRRQGVALRAGPRRSPGDDPDVRHPRRARAPRSDAPSSSRTSTTSPRASIPPIVGMHVLAGTPLTVEVVAKGSDTGGAPARVDGRPRLLEAMCFPPEFDQSRIPVFNTNTSLIDGRSARRPGRSHLARRGETGRRMRPSSSSSGSTTSSPPTSRRRSSSVPRSGPARALPAGEGAGRISRRSSRTPGVARGAALRRQPVGRRPARSSRSKRGHAQASGTLSARSRHRFVPRPAPTVG